MRPTSLAFVVLAACSSSSNETSFELSGSTEGATSESRVVITLFGFDTEVADVPATKIEVYELPFASGGDIVIETPSHPNELIEQFRGGPVPAAEARYYFDFSIDLDNDGQLCPGELYDGAEFRSYDLPPATVAVELLTLSAGSPCAPLPE